MVLVLNDLDVVKTLVCACVGNANNGGCFGLQPWWGTGCYLKSACFAGQIEECLRRAINFFPAVGRLNLLINAPLISYRCLNSPSLWIFFVVLEASKAFFFFLIDAKWELWLICLIIESKHVIYFNRNSFECAALNFCNRLLLQVRVCLK